ncbi:MAG: flavoprotein [Gammaproteobacteria bacterium]|jgi:dihydromethanopterin reductase (acceptor)
MYADRNRARFAWGITGSGHYLEESLALAAELDAVDLFCSKAGGEVLQMYGHSLSDLRKRMRVYTDNTASSPPVGEFYHGQYHTLVVAPATSNTVAKCVWGLSDTLVTNIFAQAGKCRIPIIVFACDSKPVMRTDAPEGPVMVYPRHIDLENTERLCGFEHTQVVTTLEQLQAALKERTQWLNTCCS